MTADDVEEDIGPEACVAVVRLPKESGGTSVNQLSCVEVGRGELAYLRVHAVLCLEHVDWKPTAHQTLEKALRVCEIGHCGREHSGGELLWVAHLCSSRSEAKRRK